MNMYPPIRDRRVQIVNQFKGFTTFDPLHIKDEYAVEAINLDAIEFPALQTRDPIRRYGQALTASVYPYNGIQGLFRYKYWNGSALITNDVAISNGGVYKYLNGAWSLVYQHGFGMIRSVDWDSALFPVLGVTTLFLTYGQDGLLWMFDGTNYTPLSTGAGVMTYIEAHDNRLYGAINNTVKFSALRNHADWTTVNDAGFIEVETTDGEIISGIKAGQGHLLIFKPNSMHELYGTGPEDYRLVTIADDIGAINNKCVVTVENVTYFMHTSGVYAYTGGRPKRISETVQSIFDSFNASFKHQCFLGSYKNRLIVNVGNDFMLVYHTEYDVWTRWTGFNGTCMLNNSDDFLVGSSNGKIYSLQFGVSEESAVSWSWQSKPFRADTMHRNIRFTRLWLTLNDVVGTMNTQISRSLTGFTSPETIYTNTYLSSVPVRERILIPATTAENAKHLSVRLSGIGTATLHEIVRETKISPLV